MSRQFKHTSLLLCSIANGMIFVDFGNKVNNPIDSINFQMNWFIQTKNIIIAIKNKEHASHIME